MRNSAIVMQHIDILWAQQISLAKRARNARDRLSLAQTAWELGEYEYAEALIDEAAEYCFIDSATEKNLTLVEELDD